MGIHGALKAWGNLSLWDTNGWFLWGGLLAELWRVQSSFLLDKWRKWKESPCTASHKNKIPRNKTATEAIQRTERKPVCSSGEKKREGRRRWSWCSKEGPDTTGKDSEPQCYWPLGSIIPVVRTFPHFIGSLTSSLGSTRCMPLAPLPTLRCLVRTKSVSWLCQMSSWRQNHPQLTTLTMGP